MRVEIIAELAQGFEGRPEQSRLLMKAAATAGADAAKYQLVYADELATPDYQHYELFRTLQMDDEVWARLAADAAELGIQLHLDIFGIRSLQLAQQLGVPVVKVHGTDISNVGFLEKIAASSVPRVMLGAGGAFAGELERAIGILAAKQLVVLLGFQGYPTPNDANQIDRVKALAGRLGAAHPNVTIGFADHAPPDSPLRYALAAAAVGAGASVIEKHLTLGQVMKLEDHESALNPDEFAVFCQVIRGCADAIGATLQAEDFGMSEAEQGYRKMIRRHVVAGRDLAAGTRLSPADLILKRTSAEQVLTDLASAYRKTLKRELKFNAPLSPADVE